MFLNNFKQFLAIVICSEITVQEKAWCEWKHIVNKNMARDLFLNSKACLEIDSWHPNCGKLLEMPINVGITNQK